MKRSRIENNDLKYNIRVNGRIYAAFLRLRPTEDTALAIIRENPQLNVELGDQDGNALDFIKGAFIP